MSVDDASKWILLHNFLSPDLCATHSHCMDSRRHLQHRNSQSRYYRPRHRLSTCARSHGSAYCCHHHRNGAQNGILVRDRLALEAAREIDIVIFDKTGTLTQGQFGVADMTTADGWDSSRALALASALESDSEHLIAQAIRRFARDRQLVIPPVSNFSALKGRGVQATYDGQTYYIGGPRLLEMLALSPASNIKSFTDSANSNAQSVVYLTTKENIIGGRCARELGHPTLSRSWRAAHVYQHHSGCGQRAVIAKSRSVILAKLPTRYTYYKYK